MGKLESSQKEESRSLSTESANACNHPTAFIRQLTTGTFLLNPNLVLYSFLLLAAFMMCRHWAYFVEESYITSDLQPGAFSQLKASEEVDCS